MGEGGRTWPHAELDKQASILNRTTIAATDAKKGRGEELTPQKLNFLRI